MHNPTRGKKHHLLTWLRTSCLLAFYNKLQSVFTYSLGKSDNVHNALYSKPSLAACDGTHSVITITNRNSDDPVVHARVHYEDWCAEMS